MHGENLAPTMKLGEHLFALCDMCGHVSQTVKQSRVVFIHHSFHATKDALDTFRTAIYDLISFFNVSLSFYFVDDLLVL